MSIASMTKAHLANLKRAYNEYVALAEARAKLDLAQVRSKAEKEKVLLHLEREKMAAKRELYAARLATQKDRKATEKIRLEAGDLTVAERLTKAGTWAGRGAVATIRTFTQGAGKGYKRRAVVPRKKRKTSKK